MLLLHLWATKCILIIFYFILTYGVHIYYFKMIMRYWPIFFVFPSNTELSKYKKILRTIKQHSYVYIIICILMYIYKKF